MTMANNSITCKCYCGEEREIYFPCSDEILLREQLAWLFSHLSKHNGMYHETPFNLDVTAMKVDWKINDYKKLDIDTSRESDIE